VFDDLINVIEALLALIVAFIATHFNSNIYSSVIMLIGDLSFIKFESKSLAKLQ